MISFHYYNAERFCCRWLKNSQMIAERSVKLHSRLFLLSLRFNFREKAELVNWLNDTFTNSIQSNVTKSPFDDGLQTHWWRHQGI